MVITTSSLPQPLALKFGNKLIFIGKGHKMTLSEKKIEFSLNVKAFINHIVEQGFKYTIKEDPKICNEKGIGKILRNSLHRKKLAVDINIFCCNEHIIDKDTYNKFGWSWKSLHYLNRWNGNIKNHFEMHDL